MNKVLFLCFSLSLISVSLYSQFRLDIEINGLKNNNGRIMLQVFDSSQNPVDSLMNTISDKKCTFLLSNLPKGKYAVRYYHDENSNGKMETNIFGKPVEGYGFSNNVTGKFGPPPFDKWLFEIYTDTTIRLTPVY